MATAASGSPDTASSASFGPIESPGHWPRAYRSTCIPWWNTWSATTRSACGPTARSSITSKDPPRPPTSRGSPNTGAAAQPATAAGCSAARPCTDGRSRFERRSRTVGRRKDRACSCVRRRSADGAVLSREEATDGRRDWRRRISARRGPVVWHSQTQLLVLVGRPNFTVELIRSRQGAVRANDWSLVASTRVTLRRGRTFEAPLLAIHHRVPLTSGAARALLGEGGPQLDDGAASPLCPAGSSSLSRCPWAEHGKCAGAGIRDTPVGRGYPRR
jgi:hypothetical protein